MLLVELDDIPEDYDTTQSKTNATYEKSTMSEEDAYFNRVIEKKYEVEHKPCDKKSNLYILQQDLFITGKILQAKGKSNCSRYLIVIIILSNLLIH